MVLKSASPIQFSGGPFAPDSRRAALSRLLHDDDVKAELVFKSRTDCLIEFLRCLLHTFASVSFDLKSTRHKLGTVSWVFTARTPFPCYRRSSSS
ncbi:unnamed protein product [Citrullus colocynthis]|uniref:Uncharacterized protein n=1 Tax=Citrullus colocynthis TaxID=252529 RepID=A0ABP0YKN3_9ROSI